MLKLDNNTIEDFIILRNDGTPTYNLSATVDDHQMNMTHIIRGDDHKINTFQTNANLLSYEMGCSSICTYTSYSYNRR